MSSGTDIDRKLELARELVSHLEAGNSDEAERAIEYLSEDRECMLFREVGRLTRDLHEAINGFLLDSRIGELVEHEIPDASERLNYVINMTEKAANTSLAAVEASLPLAEELGSKAGALAGDWSRFQQRDLSVEEFRVLSGELAGFLQTTRGHSEELHGKLSEVLMAQDFQDLTGQVISQVIKLIQDVEDKLVRLIRISGSKVAPADHANTNPIGPVIPGIDQGEVVSGQDDVDDLLSSLGF
jgi:chemotaxis protein CheZ